MIPQTIKNKIFCLYWKPCMNKYYNDSGHLISENITIDKLFVKPICDITNEDAKEIANLVYTDVVPDEKKIKDAKDFLNYVFNNLPLSSYRYEQLKEFDLDIIIHLEIIDLLRSKGYATPVLGYSIEQLIDEGIFSLKYK